MIRKIITIDQEKCNGCGLCVEACHEGAIGLVNGKAQLLREDYCDGLGDCLPACPTNAITFEQREAAPFNHATEETKAKPASPCGCPSSSAQAVKGGSSQLGQWPVQIKLVNPTADYFDNADILIAADCCAYAYGNFHHQFMSDRLTLIGCPKLDDIDYANKLSEIFTNHQINSITITRMEVPCCSGIVAAVQKALSASGKDIPTKVITLSIDGKIITI